MLQETSHPCGEMLSRHFYLKECFSILLDSITRLWWLPLNHTQPADNLQVSGVNKTGGVRTWKHTSDNFQTPWSLWRQSCHSQLVGDAPLTHVCLHLVSQAVKSRNLVVCEEPLVIRLCLFSLEVKREAGGVQSVYVVVKETEWLINSVQTNYSCC